MKKASPQKRPGSEQQMREKPVSDNAATAATPKLKNKIALITGGDSGIGKAVAILFAKEGADVAIAYWKETADARETKATIEEEYGRTCLLIPGDISKEQHCKKIVSLTVKQFGRIDILVNNAAIHYEEQDLSKVTAKQLKRTFEVDVYPLILHHQICFAPHETWKCYHQYIFCNCLPRQ